MTIQNKQLTNKQLILSTILIEGRGFGGLRCYILHVGTVVIFCDFRKWALYSIHSADQAYFYEFQFQKISELGR